MKETLLSVSIENGIIEVHMENSPKVVLSITDTIWSELLKKNTVPLDYLFGVVVHLLARDFSESLQKQFIEAIEKEVPRYRDEYKKEKKKIKQNKNYS